LDFIVFIPLAIFLAMNHESREDRYYRNSSLMLAAFVVVTFVHNMYLAENWDLFSSAYDITYFSTALPFCMLAIGQKNDVRQENVCIV
jgi:peptidoglycan/LPS O-acetylase OafA/YrhL